jgi:protoporphyrinogen oxidase
VLGGGIAGLTAADALSRAGHAVTVVEATDTLGGAHRSFSAAGHLYDAGSIFYEDRAPLFDLAPGLRELCPPAAPVQRRLVPNGGLRHYPFDPREIAEWRPLTQALALGSMAVDRMARRRDGSLEAACSARIGRVLFGETGLRDYVQRFNHLPASEIHEEFFEKRMGFVERRTRTRAVLGAGLRAMRRRPVRRENKTILRLRPVGGFDMLFDRIAATLEARGVLILRNAPVGGIRREGEAFRVDLAGGDGREGVLRGAIVSTIPLDTAHRALTGEGTGLVSLDLLTLFVTAEGLDPAAGNVLFNFHERGRWKRATVHSRLYGDADAAGDRMSVEVTLPPGAAPDPEAAFRDFADHVAETGLARSVRMVGHAVTPGAYPAYGLDTPSRLDVARSTVEAAGIVAIGRQGRFEYLPTASGVARRAMEDLAAAGLVA